MHLECEIQCGNRRCKYNEMDGVSKRGAIVFLACRIDLSVGTGPERGGWCGGVVFARCLGGAWWSTVTPL